MDEPFSALDVLTAENLRSELLELWEDKKMPTRAVFIVTHNIEEAVLLGDRIVVLGKNPGRIRTDFQVDLPRPRDRKHPRFTKIVDYIYQVLTKPDGDPALPLSGPAATDTQPKYPMLPHARTGGIAGFLEILADHNGREDVYRLADLLSFEIDDLLPIVEAAALLGFVKVTEGDVEITPEGLEFSERRHPAPEGTVPQRRARTRRAAETDQARARIEVRSHAAGRLLPRHPGRALQRRRNRPAARNRHQLGTLRRTVRSRFGAQAVLHSRRNAQRAAKRGSRNRNMTVPGLSRSLIRDRTWNFFMDAIVFAGLFAVVYAIVAVARYWFSAPVAAVEISLSPAAIPRYAFYSLVRMIVAYLLSLVFAIGYGYFAAYNKRVEAPMLAVLDILQSIPVLSFLPGVMLAMVSLFPIAPVRRRVRLHRAHLHRPSLEHGLQLLCVAQSAAARIDGSVARLPLQQNAAISATGTAARRHRTGVELHGLGGGRLVLPDGLRNVRARQARFSPARPRLATCNRPPAPATPPRSPGASPP